MRGDPGDVDAAGAALDDDQGVETPQENGIDVGRYVQLHITSIMLSSGLCRPRSGRCWSAALAGPIWSA